MTHSHLFEVSWEVCNKVGGIFTVITSKLPQALAEFPDRYMAIGPYFPESHLAQFQEEALPLELERVATSLKQRGIILHYGKWRVTGQPPVVLIDFNGLIPELNQLKAHLWERYQLDTLGSNFYDLDQPLLWSLAVGAFIEEYSKQKEAPFIVQGHEWLSAGLFLHLNELNNPRIKTVFTTHATVLGRALSSANVFIYDQLKTINPDRAAEENGVKSKHQLEKLAATLCTTFTTVSKVTADEAEAFLGRPVDVIVENGLNTEDYPSFDQLCLLKSGMRERLHDFISAYFFPSYQFDLSQTHLQFTMGRYEVHNKGYDLYLKSLGELNKRLREWESSQTVISFFLVPGNSHGLRPEVSTQLTIYNRICQLLKQNAILTQREIYARIWQPEATDQLSILSTEVHNQIEWLTARFPRPEPSVSPFQLGEGEQDQIVKLAAQHGLYNRPEDPVKLLFFPIYFDGLDGIFNVSLYELISGFDLGVFPSLYEPWGYTPMESLLMGIPAVTSNLAGFGRAVAEHTDLYSEGIFLLDRSSQAPEEADQVLLSYLQTSLKETDRQWLQRRMAAYTKVQSFSWKQLYRNYTRAYATKK